MTSSVWRAAVPSALYILRILKGFRNKAQGCEERATLGQYTEKYQPQRPTGLCHHHGPPETELTFPTVFRGARCALMFSVTLPLLLFYLPLTDTIDTITENSCGNVSSGKRRG